MSTKYNANIIIKNQTGAALNFSTSWNKTGALAAGQTWPASINASGSSSQYTVYGVNATEGVDGLIRYSVVQGGNTVYINFYYTCNSGGIAVATSTTSGSVVSNADPAQPGSTPPLSVTYTVSPLQ